MFLLKLFRHPISQNTCRLIEGDFTKALFSLHRLLSHPAWSGTLAVPASIRSGPEGARGVFEFGLGSLSGINLILV